MNPQDLLIPAMTAGIMAVGITLAIERLGGRAGGLLGTLPSTIVPAAWGIEEAAPGIDAFRIAMLGVPFGMLLNAGFLFCWRALPARLAKRSLRARLFLTVTLSLAAWMLLALVLVLSLSRIPDDVSTRLVLGLGATGISILFGLFATRRVTAAPRGHHKVGAATLFFRGVGAAGAVALAVWIAHVGSPLLAGMASVFPAIFLTTMLSLWLAQGETVPVGAVGPMMLGSVSVSVFALLAAFTFPRFGAATGTLVSWVAAATLATLPAFWWVSRKPKPPGVARPA